MIAHSHSAHEVTQSSHRFHLGQLLLQVGRIMLYAVLFFSIYMLGHSMVQHRFFRGGRIHRNGTLGQ